MLEIKGQLGGRWRFLRIASRQQDDLLQPGRGRGSVGAVSGSAHSRQFLRHVAKMLLSLPVAKKYRITPNTLPSTCRRDIRCRVPTWRFLPGRSYRVAQTENRSALHFLCNIRRSRSRPAGKTFGANFGLQNAAFSSLRTATSTGTGQSIPSRYRAASPAAAHKTWHMPGRHVPQDLSTS